MWLRGAAVADGARVQPEGAQAFVLHSNFKRTPFFFLFTMIFLLLFYWYFLKIVDFFTNFSHFSCFIFFSLIFHWIFLDFL